MTIYRGTKLVDAFNNGGNITDDQYFLNKGNDTVNAGTGTDIISGDAGNDVLNAGAGNDLLFGGDGNDSLDGSTGQDTMEGGDGSDTYFVDDINDLTIEIDDTTAAGGTDTVKTSVSFTLDTNIENGSLTGFSGNLVLTGNGLANTLTDNTGSDTVNTLDGGTGADIMQNLNNFTGDVFLVDSAGDTVTGSAATTDKIISDISWSLLTHSTGVENLTLSALAAAGSTATGNAGINTITGNDNGVTLDGGANNDVLIGGTGNDKLIGGTGNDDMTGGDGNDTYVVDAAGDTVNENAAEGNDTVLSSITYTLGSDVDNLTLTGALGTENLNGTGNTDDNVITGNNGNNVLDGVAATTFDILRGMGGNDTLYFHGNESIDGGNGTDTIISDSLGSNLYLGDFTSIENGTVLDAAGADVSLVGTNGANTLTGNDLGMIIDDGGPGAADHMNGGSGDDTFIVHNSGDIISDTGGTGDKVIVVNNLDNGGGPANLSYALSGDIEDLELQGYTYYNGALAMTGTGNALQNTITDSSYTESDGWIGNAINNILVGGDGDDTLVNNTNSNSWYGATGTETLDGGLGADTMSSSNKYGNKTVFIVDNVGDSVSGTQTKNGYGSKYYRDTVKSSIDWDLNVQTTGVFNLVLTGTGNINGTGADGNFGSLTGNDGNNILTGGDSGSWISGGKGNDSLDGGTGSDNALYGGLGNDTFFTHVYGNDSIYENFNEGTDTIVADFGFDLDNYSSNIENGTLSEAAGIADISGTASTNVLTGNSFDNSLDGEGGADQMVGGDGNDDYNVDNVGDSVVENLNEGTDEVYSSISYTLGANVENLTLGFGNINGTGNGLDNIINGDGGNNILNGAAGADTLTGNGGNDTFVVDNANDTAVGDTGTDLVQSSVDWDLGGANSTAIENLTLTGAAINGTGDANANTITGNTANNVLTGNDGNDVLNGGTGLDTMIGGGDDDTYFVDNAGDVVTENLGEGNDTVNASINYVLTAGEIENLNIIGTATTGTGNDANNIITGNNLANTIDGGAGADTIDGGLGNDKMTGGDGNDLFIVNSTSDTIIETSLFDIDSVQSSATFTLGANVENLTLTGGAAINGTGNNSVNILTGNTGANSLSGLGGADTIDGGLGADSMNGGLGDDLYYVDNAGDKEVEAAGAGTGTDTVHATVSHTIGLNVENLILEEGFGNINGTGNASANTITGNSENNVLNGLTGADVMVGNGGNDTFFVDNAADNVTGGAGIDTVSSAITWDLNVNTSANVDNLTLTGTGAINGTGNAIANVITGAAGTNVLTGGSGNDTLLGMGGNDTLNGGNDNDFLTGGLGHDILTGGSGADTFIYNEARPLSAVNSDTITDFTAGGGNDVLDISGILDGYGGGSLNNFVHLVQSGANVLVQVDHDSSLVTTNAFVTIAQLNGITLAALGTDADGMVAQGNLIASI